MGERILGQDVEVSLLVDGQAQAAYRDIRHFEVEAQIDILREGYLGEKTDRRDEVFRGIKGRMEFHFESSAFATTIQKILDRVRRRTPGTLINIKATLNFSDASRAIIVIPDASFGNIPITFNGRAEYGTLSLDFEAPDFRLIPA